MKYEISGKSNNNQIKNKLKNHKKQGRKKNHLKMMEIFDKWQLMYKKDCQKMCLDQSFTEMQIEQILQSKRYSDNIIIENLLIDDQAKEIISQNLKNFDHLKGLGLVIRYKITNNKALLKGIADNLHFMKELNNLQISLNCESDLSGMAELAKNLSSLSNLTHFSLHLNKSEKMALVVSTLFKQSLKELNLTHLEYKFEGENEQLFNISQFVTLINGFECQTNLVCLQLHIGRIYPLGNEGFQCISNSLENLTKLEYLSLQFDCAQDTSKGALSPLQRSLLNLKALKELNLLFQDFRFDEQDQYELYDAMFECQNLETLKIKSFLTLQNKFDYRYGCNTSINSKLKNLSLQFNVQNRYGIPGFIHFDENILRITQLDSFKLHLYQIALVEKERAVFDSLLKNNTSLQILDIYNLNNIKNSLDFFINLNPLLSNTSNLQRLNLHLDKEICLQSLLKSFSKSSSYSRLEELALEIRFKVLFKAHDFTDSFQKLKHLKKLKLIVEIKENSQILLVNMVVSLQHLPTLEILDLSLFNFDISSDKTIFKTAFEKLVNLKELMLYIVVQPYQTDFSGTFNIIEALKNLVNLEFLCWEVPFNSFSNITKQTTYLANCLNELTKLRVFKYFAFERQVNLDILMIRKLKKLIYLSHFD